MKRLILILLLFISALSYGQTTNMVGAWQKVNGGEQVQFRESSGGNIIKVTTPKTLEDSLANYAKIQDGVIESPTVTTNGDSLIIGNGVVRINGSNIDFAGKTFGDIPPSSANLSRIFVVYSDESGVLDSISGTQSNNPVAPTLPSNTQAVVTVSVSDAGLGVPEIDLTGYAKLNEKNEFTIGQNITGDLAINNGTIRTNRRFEFYRRDADPRLPFPTSIPNFGIGINDNSSNNLTIEKYTGGGGSSARLAEWTYSTGVLDFKFTPTVNGVPLGNGDVASVNGQTGTVVLDADDISDASTTNKWTNATEKATWNGKENVLTFNAPLSRSTNTISIVDATGSVSGVINTGTQTFGGAKTFNSTVRASNFGAGIAPNANFGITTSASTSTTGSFLWTPGVAYIGTQNGAGWYETTNSRLRMRRGSSSDDFLFNGANVVLAGSGVRIPSVDSTGAISATIQYREIVDIETNASTYTLDKSGTYTFYGTSSTFTLPTVTGNSGKEYTIINMGSGNITLNSNSGGNDIWENGSSSSTHSIMTGGTIRLVCARSKFVVNP